MNCDEKNMIEDRASNNDVNDMKLVPFNNQIPSNNVATGWIPVFFFNNGSPSMSSGQFAMPNISNLVNKATGTSSSTTSSNTTTNQNPNKFPSDENIENLYSYNNAQESSNLPKASSTTKKTARITEILRSLNIEPEEINLTRDNSTSKINSIYETLENNNSELISLMEAYDMPSPISKLLVSRISAIAINTYNKEGD